MIVSDYVSDLLKGMINIFPCTNTPIWNISSLLLQPVSLNGSVGSRENTEMDTLQDKVQEKLAWEALPKDWCNIHSNDVIVLNYCTCGRFLPVSYVMSFPLSAAFSHVVISFSTAICLRITTSGLVMSTSTCGLETWLAKPLPKTTDSYLIQHKKNN